jgi:putative transcriptional regulator
MTTSLQGHFLVASPHLPDVNFFRTVVLLIQHSEEGAFGVVLNRPSDKSVSQVWDLIGEDACNCNDPVYLGGPVEGPLICIHSYAPCGQNEILPGLFMASRSDLLNRVVRSAARFRVFCSYSGWGPGQLESELEAGGWLTCPATMEDVFQDVDEMWRRVTGKIGLEILAPTIGKRRVPDEPWLN